MLDMNRRGDREISTEVIFSSPWFSLRHDVIATPNGSQNYTYLDFQHAGVRVVAVNALGEVCLVRQYRHPVRADLWEIPAGGIEPGETAIEAAQRELAEEAGVVADRWTPLGKVRSLVNATNFEAHLFLAEGLHDEGTRRFDPDGIELSRYFSLPELGKLLEAGELVDDKTLSALLVYRSADVFGRT
ncbi:NUDIX hydrolase [Actinosynnema sp. CA-248983]